MKLPIEPSGTEPCKVPCLHCPFRKNRPNWMDKDTLALNLTRAKYGIPQDCHMSFPDPLLCVGFEIMMKGGNDQIMSKEELTQLEPCSSKESRDRYDGRVNDYGKTKYHRTIFSCVKPDEFTVVDVYSVLKAFNVSCPARQHAIKKLLCAGIRGKGDEITDLREASVALNRAIDISQME